MMCVLPVFPGGMRWPIHSSFMHDAQLSAIHPGWQITDASQTQQRSIYAP